MNEPLNFDPEPILKPAPKTSWRRKYAWQLGVLAFLILAIIALSQGNQDSYEPKQKSQSANQDAELNPKTGAAALDNYKLAVENPTEANADAETVLRLAVLDQNNERVFDFDVTDERVLHLMIVRADLRFYYNVHPRFETDTATFIQKFHFPTPGEWRLFADLKPTGQNNGLLETTLTVPGPYAPQALTVNESFIDAPEVAAVTLNTAPNNIKVLAPTILNLTVKDPTTDKPVTDLGQFMGLDSYGLAVNQDTQAAFVLRAEADLKKPGLISFNTNFPEVGRWRIFTQFRRGERVVSSFNTLDVTQ